MSDLAWEDILIIGDSFVRQRTDNTDWPKIVASALTGLNSNNNKSVRGKGFSGASWWSSRKMLIRELEQRPPKILIMTHTEMQRIPSDDDYGLNSASVFNIDYYAQGSKNRLKEENLCPLEVLQAGQEYYKHLFSKDFHLWSQQSWFHEIDELITKYSIEKVVHLHSFHPWDPYKIHIFKNGITFDKALWPMSDDHHLMMSKATWNKVNDNLKVPEADMWAKNPTRNHFTTENNKKLASIVLKNLNNYSNGSRAITFNDSAI